MDAVLYASQRRPWRNGRPLGKPAEKLKSVQERQNITSQVFKSSDVQVPFAIDGDLCDTNVAESFRLLIDELNQKFEVSTHEAIPFSSTSHDRKNLNGAAKEFHFAQKAPIVEPQHSGGIMVRSESMSLWHKIELCKRGTR